MDPNNLQQNQQQPGVPVQYAGSQPGQLQNFGQMPMEEPEARKSRLPIILTIIAVAIIFMVIGLGIGVAISPKKAPKPATDTSQNAGNQGPQPATEIGVTQTSNSISQDISDNNEDRDLPATMLDDKTLGL